MRIAIVSDCYYPTMNGVSGMVSLLKSGLEERGHRALLIAPAARGGGAWAQAAPPPDFAVPSLPLVPSVRLRLPLASLRSVEALLRRERIQLVHTHTEGPLGRAAGIAARRAGLPLVHTLHTFYSHYLHYLPFGRRAAAALLPRWWRSFLTRCDLAAAPSAAAADFLRGIAPAARVELLPNAAAGCARPAEEELLRRRFGIDPGDGVVLAAGRTAPEKRSMELLRAFVPHLAADRRLKLLFAGGGPLLGRLRREAAAAGLAGRVILPGYLTREELFGLYRVSSVLASASLSENFPLTLLEAASCALPAAVLVDGNPDHTVLDGVNGITAGSDDELALKTVELLKDGEKLRLCGLASLRTAERFSPQSHVRAAERIYSFFISTV